MSEHVRILNISKQMVPIQARPPRSEFYANESQIRLMPGKDALVLKSHLLMDQIENLCKKGILKVVYDSTKSDS